MNAFATIVHLVRTDLRHFRLFVIAFITVNIAASIIERAPLPDLRDAASNERPPTGQYWYGVPRGAR